MYANRLSKRLNETSSTACPFIVVQRLVISDLAAETFGSKACEYHLGCESMLGLAISNTVLLNVAA